MAPIGKLWAGRRQARTKIICSAAALNDLELEFPQWSYKEKSAAFTNKFSYGKIPAFEGADGFKLTEGMTIARYMCSLGTKTNLLGSNAKESMLVDQWTHFAEQEMGGPNRIFFRIVYGSSARFNQGVLDRQTKRLTRVLDHVESHLATCRSGYLVSDSITLADLALAGMVYTSSIVALGAAERAKYPRVFAHYAKVTGHEKVKKFWGTKRFTEVAAKEHRSLKKRT